MIDNEMSELPDRFAGCKIATACELGGRDIWADGQMEERSPIIANGWVLALFRIGSAAFGTDSNWDWHGHGTTVRSSGDGMALLGLGMNCRDFWRGYLVMMNGF